MSTRILSGIEARNARLDALKERIRRLSFAPELAIVQVGDRADSTSYIRAKTSFAEKIGVKTRHIRMSASVSEPDLIRSIDELNKDAAVKGIIVQLPLPAHIQQEHIIERIDPRKDVDGLTPTNVDLLERGDSKAIIPATARGVVELLSYYQVAFKNKKVVVIGRSALVGTPIARLLSNKGADVVVVHSKTIDPVQEIRKADVIIVAVGKPRFIGSQHAVPGQIMIDVGINEDVGEGDGLTSRKLVGDVDFEAVKAILGPSGAISPVPGGVGPMTVLGLFENVADVCDKI